MNAEHNKERNTLLDILLEYSNFLIKEDYMDFRCLTEEHCLDKFIEKAKDKYPELKIK